MKTVSGLLVVISVVALALLTGAHPTTTSVAAVQNDENVSFRWAFGAMVGKEKRFVSITRDTVLKSGDDMKMYVELVKDCFVYFINQDSKGKISVVFPTDGFKQFTADYKVGKPYYMPKGRGWYQLDNSVGRETFYLLGSSERLLELESLIGNYLSADESKKQELAQNIISEIRSVRKRYKSFATLAEKPITIGGNVRGMEKAEEMKRPDVSTIATHITATNFYGKTFSIEHQ
jgi:hypothetical protein